MKLTNEEIKNTVKNSHKVLSYFEKEDYGMALLNAIDKTIKLKDEN